MAEISYRWRGEFTNDEVNELHADAFEHRVHGANEWDWSAICERHSLGWVSARDSDDHLVGFVNVPWDGFIHAWLQDVMVSSFSRRLGIGVQLVHAARDGARQAGCEWLHVDFDDELRPFYLEATGFAPTMAGLIDLTALGS